MVMSGYCSCKGPEFEFKHPCSQFTTASSSRIYFASDSVDMNIMHMCAHVCVCVYIMYVYIHT